MKIKDLTQIALFTALCAVCAWMTIPFGIPFTLQTFAVFLACLVLGGRKAAISTVVYLLLGAVGVPVFSGFRGGIGVLAGVTGGYLVGFPVLCLVYALLTRILKKTRAAKAVALVAGLLVLYLFGTVWYVLIYTGAQTVGFTAAAMKCVVPFILPDLVKMALAFLVGSRLKAFFR